MAGNNGNLAAITKRGARSFHLLQLETLAAARQALPVLTEALESSDPEARLRAAEALLNAGVAVREPRALTLAEAVELVRN